MSTTGKKAMYQVFQRGPGCGLAFGNGPSIASPREPDVSQLRRAELRSIGGSPCAAACRRASSYTWKGTALVTKQCFGSIIAAYRPAL